MKWYIGDIIRSISGRNTSFISYKYNSLFKRSINPILWTKYE
jgi:hypothetical protein